MVEEDTSFRRLFANVQRMSQKERPTFYRQELNKTMWEVPERYQHLTPVGSGAYGSVWYVHCAGGAPCGCLPCICAQKKKKSSTTEEDRKPYFNSHVQRLFPFFPIQEAARPREPGVALVWCGWGLVLLLCTLVFAFSFLLLPPLVICCSDGGCYLPPPLPPVIVLRCVG